MNNFERSPILKVNPFVIRLSKNTFANSVKGGSMIKQIPCFITHTHHIEEMVLGYLPVLHTLAWVFYKGDII
jgi:hypothetical protein